MEDKECTESHAKGKDIFAISVVSITSQKAGRYRHRPVTASTGAK
jgi:hypothetical protein